MKQYVRPEVFFEHYELSQQVAACGWDLNQASAESCAAYYDENIKGQATSGPSIFNDRSYCGTTDVEGICYTTAVETNRVFNS